jgi:hypothetical protein
VLCPKGEQLEAAHRELGDAVALDAVSGLPDGTTHLLDHVIIDLVKGVKVLISLLRLHCRGLGALEGPSSSSSSLL